MIYLIVYIYLLLLVFRYDVLGKKQGFLWNYIFLFLVFTFVAGFRYRLGTDTIGYFYSFTYDTLPLSDLKIEDVFHSKNQPFWVILCSFCKSFGNFILLQVSVSLFTNFSIFYFVFKVCKKPFTVILIYYLLNYFYFSMEILRESLAIGCFLFSIIQMNKKKYLNSYIWLISAFMFHFFSLFLFFIPIYIYKNVSFQKMSVLVIVILLCMVFKENIIEILVTVLSFDVSYKLLQYSQNEFYIESELNIIGVFFKFVLPFCFVILFLLFYGHSKKNIILLGENIWKPMILLYLMFLFTTINIPITERFSNYFFMIAALLFASCFYLFPFTDRSKILLISVVSVLILIYQVNMMIKIDPLVGVPNYARYYPYSSVFDKNETVERRIYNNYWH